MQDGLDFDGATYDRRLDRERLQAQLTRVWYRMCDHKWHTLAELARDADAPQASVSARIRDLRKRKFGGYDIARRRVSAGLYEYCLLRTVKDTVVKDG